MASMDLVTVGGVELNVLDEGTGPAIVLLHGFPELAYSWRHVVGPFVDAGYRVIAPDLRGFGGSSKPDQVEAYGLEHLVGDVLGLIDALDLGRPTVVGHDWGAVIAWSLAVMHPDRIDKLVSLNVPYRGWCSAFPTTETIREQMADRFGYVLMFQEPGVAEAWFESDPAGKLRAFYSGGASDPAFLTDDEFAVFLDAFVSGGITGPVNLYRNIDANAAATQHLANAPVTVPTLMIATDSDPVLPPSLVEGMDRWVPDLRVEVIGDCGHWTQQERPDEVVRLILDFLSG
ncbi:MAG: alpha/beta hydrolase [Acidimicrobiia bacterium]|nr:alpha/beta hydrolase [Acidimicrobiia bacterium]